MIDHIDTTDTPNPARLTVARLTMRNCLSVEDRTIDLDPGVNVLAGRNESGKTTALLALRSVLGLNRATLVTLTPTTGDRELQPSVEALLLSEDNQTEVRIKREGSQSPEVKYRQGAVWHEPKRPVEWLNALVNVRAALPALWLLADDETKARMILEACVIEGYSRTAALEAMGLPDFELPPIPDGLHPLEDLQAIEAAVRASRKVIGSHARDKQSAATELLSKLPANAPADESDTIAALERSTTEAHADIAAADARILGDYEAARVRAIADGKTIADGLRANHAATAAEMRAAVEARIGELATEMETEIETLRRRSADRVQSAALERDASQVVLAGRREQLAADREQLASYRAQQESVAIDRSVRATAERMEDEAEAYQRQYDALTEALSLLSEYRLQLADQLPIKGLAVTFDEKGKKRLEHNGKPSEHWSDGEVSKLAMEYAMLGSAPPVDGRPFLPIILLDRAGDLSAGRRSALLREVAAHGNQVIAAVTEECDFAVLSGDDALAPVLSSSPEYADAAHN